MNWPKRFCNQNSINARQFVFLSDYRMLQAALSKILENQTSRAFILPEPAWKPNITLNDSLILSLVDPIATFKFTSLVWLGLKKKL